MTISHWRRTNTLGELRCDTLVLGAGVAGLSAALALRAHHVDTLVVDRAAVGSGASSRNAGYLMRGAADNYTAGVRTWGRDITRDLWRLTEHNLFLLRSRGVERLQTYQPRPSCLLALTEEEQIELHQARSMMLEDGLDAPWIETGSDTVWRSGLARAGLVNPHDAVCNPCELLAMLRAQLHAPIIEHQEAIAIEESGRDVIVTLTDGRVRANHVIACLNAYAPLLIAESAQWVAPNRGQMLTLRAPAARLDMSYYANHGSEYFRAVEPGVFVIGGWRKHFAEAERTYEDAVSHGVQNGLESFARAMFGADQQVISRWSGIMGFSPHGRPIAGPIRHGSRVWFLGGFTGHGMSLAHATASLAVDAMLGLAGLPPAIAGTLASSRA